MILPTARIYDRNGNFICKPQIVNLSAEYDVLNQHKWSMHIDLHSCDREELMSLQLEMVFQLEFDGYMYECIFDHVSFEMASREIFNCSISAISTSRVPVICERGEKFDRNNKGKAMVSWNNSMKQLEI